MNVYEWAGQIASSQLTGKGLVLVSRFARELKSVNGETLTMRDPELLKTMMSMVHSTNDDGLKTLFDELLHELYDSMGANTAMVAQTVVTSHKSAMSKTPTP